MKIKILKNAAIISSVAASLPVIAGSTISVIGFQGAGVALGSTAAVIQSSIGAVQAGSIFAGMQSIGATGLLFSAPVIIGAGLGAGALYLIY